MSFDFWLGLGIGLFSGCVLVVMLVHWAFESYAKEEKKRVDEALRKWMGEDEH
jgi:hypothetical protein